MGWLRTAVTAWLSRYIHSNRPTKAESFRLDPDNRRRTRVAAKVVRCADKSAGRPNGVLSASVRPMPGRWLDFSAKDPAIQRVRVRPPDGVPSVLCCPIG